MKGRTAPVTYGDKIVVLGSEHIEQYRPVVTDIIWVDSEHRYMIELLWGSGEESKIYSSDLGNTWLPADQYEEGKRQERLSLN